MSALSATDTQWSAIKDMHEDINLPGAGNREFEFMSGYNENNMLDWNQWMQYVYFNKAYKLRPNIKPIENPNTIYSIISKIPELSKFKNLIDYVGYGKIFDTSNKMTIFAPINYLFDTVLDYPINYAYRKSALIQALRYHILNFVISPSELIDRKLKLRTDLDKQFIETDFTNGKRQLINPFSFRQRDLGNYITDERDNWFPKTSFDVDILEIIKCDNGMIYIISRPIVFPDTL
jgi:uncharacterized surface protein with fasciclin (FAS1) repeats